jgi:uncharacterized protein YdhG (YjbR/CyaY superfamily)
MGTGRLGEAEEQIDRHLASFPKEQQVVLRDLREQIHKLIPGANERISYSMPTFEISGQILVHFDGFKDHNSLFAGSEVPSQLAKELGDLVVSKGTIKFGKTEKFPKALLKKILQLRIEHINAQYPKKSGEYLSFYDNGRLKSKGKYKDSQMHGNWEFYRKDGSLMRKGKLEHGEPVGEWQTFTRDS